ncbi:MAG TPA: ABC transporter ATP-binding protein [Streptosporangiaceae bacterium]|jgi:ABC-2 type transport system ATP-binding protein
MDSRIPAIEVRGLRRDYPAPTRRARRAGTVLHALRGIDLTVLPGQVFGLLGPNGAGKTTLTKILATLLLPSSGTARVAGHDVVADTRAVRHAVGCVFGGDLGLYERLSGHDNLRYFAELYGVPPRAARARIAELLDLVGLSGKADARVETYSRGMRQRLHLARGLLHDPQVLLLDEPTSGIDPVGARELRTLIDDLRTRGKTVLLTTHYMFEADEVCDDIAIIARGRIVARGTAADLKAMVTAGQTIEIELHGLGAETFEPVRGVPGVRAVTVESRDQVQLLRVQADPDDALPGKLHALLGGAVVGRMTVREPTLEDAYVQLVEGADEAEGSARVG